MASDSDRLLIQQIRQGDPRAWEHLISRYEGRLLAFVLRRLRDRAASEDVVQETFIGFLTSLPNFDDKRELQTYLFTIASHKLTDHLRRAGRHPLQQAPEDMLAQKFDDNPAASSLARGNERRELESHAVAAGLSQMFKEWQEQGEFTRIKVLELLFVKGWANRDVAAFLKVNEQQVANIRFAAVKKIGEHVRGMGLSGDVFPELKSMMIPRETLAGYLDDALSEAETAQVEGALRQSEPLRRQLRTLMQERDRGEHSVGAIWRRERLTCFSREHLGNYLLGILTPEQQDYLEFHLQTIGCAYCQANLVDLQTQQKEAAAKTQQRRRRYFESSAGLLRTK